MSDWSKAAVGLSREAAKAELLRMHAWRMDQLRHIEHGPKWDCVDRERKAIQAALVVLDPAFLDVLREQRAERKRQEHEGARRECRS